MWWIENIYLIWLIGILSIAVLVWSAEQVVHKMIKIAHHIWVSDTFVGLTVLSIGTSLPEISSHIIASLGIINWSLDFEIASATVLGANIWSNIVQQTLIVGLVIILVGTMTFDKKFLSQNYVAMLVTMWVVRFLGLDGLYSQSDSAVLLLLFVMYLYFLYAQEQAESNDATITKQKMQKPWLEVAGLLWGMGLLLFASTITLEAVQFMVLNTSVSGSLIWVVSLGIASALPEMITAISGVRQKAKWISLGTLIGSNIVNPLVAIWLWWVISSYYVPHPLKRWDLPMQIGTALLLLARLLTHKGKINKRWGIFLIMLYVVYLLVRMKYFNID